MGDDRVLVRAPLAATADVVVVGSGSAGACAAIAAARDGASVLLIEKQGFMGGTSTAVLDTFYGFYTPGGRAHKIVGGISDEVVAGLRELGPVVERPNTYGAGTGVTYNAEHLKIVWERLATRGRRARAPARLPAGRHRPRRSRRGAHRGHQGGPRSASAAGSTSTPAATPTSATTPASATSWPASSHPRRR